MFAPEERRSWSSKTNRAGIWRRSGSPGVQLRVAPSRIPNAGLGLFVAGSDGLDEGVELGRLSGSIRFESQSRDTAEDWALAQQDERLVLLRNGVCGSDDGVRGSSWVVVDVRGSVFEFANCSSSEESANMHVGESGRVVVECDIEPGTELVWWYDTLHSAAAVAAAVETEVAPEAATSSSLPVQLRGWGLVEARIHIGSSNRGGEGVVEQWDAISQLHGVRMMNGFKWMRLHGQGAAQFRVVEHPAAFSVTRLPRDEERAGVCTVHSNSVQLTLSPQISPDANDDHDQCVVCLGSSDTAASLQTVCCKAIMCEECWDSIREQRAEAAWSIAIVEPHNHRGCPHCRSTGSGERVCV